MLGKEQEEHDYLYWEFAARGGKQAVRSGDFKAVRNGLRRDPNAPIELYNLADDPGEEIDVADQHPEIVAVMRRIFEDARTESKDFKLFGTAG
jgi:arylsulfatase A-like enzyme